MPATKQRKILLIEPPFHRLFKETYSLDRYPLALGYLAGAVKKNTHWQVQTFNADFTPGGELIKVSYMAGEGFLNYRMNLENRDGKAWQNVRTVLEQFQPDFVGISAKSQNFTSAKIVAELARQANPRAVIIIGGPHPSMVGPEVLKYPEFDIAVRGEGERTIVELLQAIETGNDIATVNGIVYRKGSEILQTQPRELIEDLDVLDFPHASAAHTLLDYDKYPPTAFQFVFATRGCPFNCFFCGSRNIWSRKVRFRSPANVVAELKQLQRKGLRFVHFDDDTFGVTRKHIRELCSAIRLGCPNLKWSCEIHVNLVDDETMAMMKRAGCFRIQLGVESGCNEILNAMRKGFVIEQAHKACRIIKNHGLELHVFFMVGFPQETEASLAQTAQAIATISADRVLYSIFTPYPGTEAYEFCRERGLVGETVDLSMHFHQSPENCFCQNIPRDKFRSLVAEIEKKVDSRNSKMRIREMFSLNALRRIGELGPKEALRKGWQVLQGK